MKRLVFKKWVEVLVSIIALTGLAVCWGFGNINLLLSLTGAVVSIVAMVSLVMYGRI